MPTTTYENLKLFFKNRLKHQPENSFGLDAVQPKNFLRQHRLYPWQPSPGKPIVLQCHHFRQGASKHRRLVDRRLADIKQTRQQFRNFLGCKIMPTNYSRIRAINYYVNQPRAEYPVMVQIWYSPKRAEISISKFLQKTKSDNKLLTVTTAILNNIEEVHIFWLQLGSSQFSYSSVKAYLQTLSSQVNMLIYSVRTAGIVGCQSKQHNTYIAPLVATAASVALFVTG